MTSHDQNRCRRGEQPEKPGKDDAVIPFPSTAQRHPREDFLVSRLRNGAPAMAGRCPSHWADPLDAAILAALLLHHPASALAEREQMARRDGRPSEAAFWRAAGNLFATITHEELISDPS